VIQPRTVLSTSTVRSILQPANRGVLLRACRRALVPTRRTRVELERNLDSAYQWLCAAQDASCDGGVAGCYNLAKGWGNSYPETTGYIIPTFLHYSAAFHEPEARQRAIKMADWESEVQLPNGAVLSGMLGTARGPAVFNTGQVLFGWTAAYSATANSRYARSIAAASEWLTRIQDKDGAWRRCLSALTTSSVQTYNVRAAWGLAQAGFMLNEKRWTAAALKNCDWALAVQTDNGWFEANTFSDNEEPLLHTIAYVLEGLLGVGELLGRDKYVQAVMQGIHPLVAIYSRFGTLKGRYNRHWRAKASWRCLTGEAQIALVLLRLAKITGDAEYARVGRSLLDGIAQHQDLDSPYRESYGAVSGSFPIWGGYGPFNYLNWAAKFFIDGLLLHLKDIDVKNPLWQPESAEAVS
jgi:uncharacterized protein YyaL (SSP411 family)